MTFKQMDKQSREAKNFSGSGNSICETPKELKGLDNLGQGKTHGVDGQWLGR